MTALDTGGTTAEASGQIEHPVLGRALRATLLVMAALSIPSLPARAGPTSVAVTHPSGDGGSPPKSSEVPLVVSGWPEEQPDKERCSTGHATQSHEAVTAPGVPSASGNKASGRTGARPSPDKPLIVIDPGHGGHDPGSLSIDGRHQEKDVALAIASEVRKALLANGNLRVEMTRTNDRFVSLLARREFARNRHAALFISIHADSAPGSNARGASIYTLSDTASGEIEQRMQSRNDRSSAMNDENLFNQPDDIFSIVVSLRQRNSMNLSSQFAHDAQNILSLDGVRFRRDYHRYGALAVLKAPDMPSVLLEAGYMSDPSDLLLMLSERYRHLLARGLAEAVRHQFGSLESGDACDGRF